MVRESTAPVVSGPGTVVVPYAHDAPEVEPRRERGSRAVLAAILFLCVTAAVCYRTARDLNVPGAPHAGHAGLQDFRDTFYYPVLSFLEGNNPYDPSAHVRSYPVGNTFPL